MHKISIICLYLLFLIFFIPRRGQLRNSPETLNQEGSLMISKDLLMITFVHLVRNFSQVSGGKGSSTRDPRLRTLM